MRGKIFKSYVVFRPWQGYKIYKQKSKIEDNQVGDDLRQGPRVTVYFNILPAVYGDLVQFFLQLGPEADNGVVEIGLQHE